MLDRALRDLAGELRDSGRIDGSEAFIDASFARAKGGGLGRRAHESRQGHENHGDSGPERAAASRSAFTSANHHETKLAQLSLDLCLCGEPANLIGDKAYDSDPLRTRNCANGGWR